MPMIKANTPLKIQLFSKLNFVPQIRNFESVWDLFTDLNTNTRISDNIF